jgi:L-cysteate sulfo-lyase
MPKALLQRCRLELQDVARLSLGHFPTPVRELVRLRQYVGCSARLWIKNDDYAGPAFGGSKIRKLEYVLPRLLADGVNRVITGGSIASNHARITAVLCARLGLPCDLVLNRPIGQLHPTHSRVASLMVDEIVGARIHFVERPEDRVLEMNRLASQAALQGQKPRVIPIGASTALGALGLVGAAEEFAAQSVALGLNVRAIVHATSSGGTQAGLIAGVNLYGPKDTRVIGISADGPAADIISIVQEILISIDHFLGLHKTFEASQIEVDDRFTGRGYAIPSDEANDTTKLLARIEGIILDPVYTAKAMSGFLELGRCGGFGKNDDLLFWHTGGQLALFQELCAD